LVVVVDDVFFVVVLLSAAAKGQPKGDMHAENCHIAGPFDQLLLWIVALVCPEQGVKLLGLLLTGSTGQHIHGRSKWAGLIYIG
jgi:hypothetical protein